MNTAPIARALALAASLFCAACEKNQPSALEVVGQVGFDQKLDARVPLDLVFQDEHGQSVRLGEYFGDKPVVLTLVYYECPVMCTQVLNALVGSMRALRLEVGRDFEIVTVSIDARETPELARAKKARCIEQYGRPAAAAGWHFLTALPGENEAAVARLAESIGFRYAYYADVDEFAHPSGFVTLTPDGRVSRYFFGVEYPPGDLRLALVESSRGRIGTLVDQVLLLCYHYDPTTGKYGFAIMSVVRAFGLATVAALGGYVWILLRRERATARLAGGRS